jgi:hypothetical protein
MEINGYKQYQGKHKNCKKFGNFYYISYLEFDSSMDMEIFLMTSKTL